MTNNDESENQKRQAANWLAGLVENVAVTEDGAQRVLTCDEAAEAILRQWEAEEAE
jgi:hypothetical protein